MNLPNKIMKITELGKRTDKLLAELLELGKKIRTQHAYVFKRIGYSKYQKVCTGSFEQCAAFNYCRRFANNAYAFIETADNFGEIFSFLRKDDKESKSVLIFSERFLLC